MELHIVARWKCHPQPDAERVSVALAEKPFPEQRDVTELNVGEFGPVGPLSAVERGAERNPQFER